jgi:hypothetical protein
VVALKPMFQSLSGKLARIKVQASVPEARVTLGARDLGAAPVDAKVSAGTYLLKASAAGYKPAQQQVELVEGGTVDQKLTLEVAPRGSTPEAVAGLSVGTGPEQEGPLTSEATAVAARPKPGAPFQPGPYLKHPGTYVSAAGLTALLVGTGLGVSSAVVKSRIVDNNSNGALDVSRRDALWAQSSAAVANVLFAVGAVGLAGGGAWLFVSPPRDGGMGLTAGGKF